MVAAKTLIRQDGAQFCARVGMVDANGVMFDVVDGSTTYLEFHPMSWIVSDLEAENRRLSEELAAEAGRAERAARALAAANGLAGELLADGKFPRGSKTAYGERLQRLRRKQKELMGDG